MPLAGNPRQYARDISVGYVLLSPVLLRGYALGDLRTLKQALELELRDTRAEIPPADDRKAVQGKQRRIVRLNQALQVMRAYALKRRLSV